jgi:hypothetical protein
MPQKDVKSLAGVRRVKELGWEWEAPDVRLNDVEPIQSPQVAVDWR